MKMKVVFDNSRAMWRVGKKSLWLNPVGREAIVIVSYKTDVAFAVRLPNGVWNVVPMDDAYNHSPTTTRHVNSFMRLAEAEKTEIFAKAVGGK